MEEKIFNNIKQKLNISTVMLDHNKMLIKNKLGIFSLCPLEEHVECKDCSGCKPKRLPFRIEESRGIFYCFNCHKGGDVIALISLLKNITIKESVNYLSEKYKHELQ